MQTTIKSMHDDISKQDKLLQEQKEEINLLKKDSSS